MDIPGSSISLPQYDRPGHLNPETARTMNGLIRASLRNPIAVTVMTLTLVLLGGLAAYAIPVDILPVFKSPAVQVLTFYGGMPAASIEKDITSRMERGVGQASGGERLESRSIVGASIVRDYFGGHVDPNGALTQCTRWPAGSSRPAAGHAAAGRPAVRPDEHHAGLPRRAGQPDRRAGRQGGTRGPCTTSAGTRSGR